MGWAVTLQDENGNIITTLDLEILEPVNLEKYKLLKYVDPFGDTTFNCLQMNDLIEDFNKLVYDFPQLNEQIDGIINLAKTCKDHIHQYLKFNGD